MFESNRWAQVMVFALVMLVLGSVEAGAQAAAAGGGGGGGGRPPMTPIAYRQGIMQELQTNMAALNAVRAGQVGATSHTVERATILQSLAAMMGDAFADDSQAGQTRALPAIWSSPAEFSQRVQEFQAAADALVAAARSGDDAAIANAQSALQQSCSSCHMQFRAPAQ